MLLGFGGVLVGSVMGGVVLLLWMCVVCSVDGMLLFGLELYFVLFVLVVVLVVLIGLVVVFVLVLCVVWLDFVVVIWG